MVKLALLERDRGSESERARRATNRQAERTKKHDEEQVHGTLTVVSEGRRGQERKDTSCRSETARVEDGEKDDVSVLVSRVPLQERNGKPLTNLSVRVKQRPTQNQKGSGSEKTKKVCTTSIDINEKQQKKDGDDGQHDAIVKARREKGKSRTQVAVQCRDLQFETLALADTGDDVLGLTGLQRGAGKELPVVEDGLRESLTGGGLSEIGVESERLVDGEVSLDGNHGSTNTGLLGEDVSTSPVEARVDTTETRVGALDLDEVDGLLDTGLGKQSGGIADTSAGGDELSTTSVNGIGVESDIEDVESGTSHGLFGADTLLGGPLEGGDARVLDFVEVLNTLGDIDEKVGAGGLGTEAPNLTGVSDIPSVVVSKDTSTSLEIVTGGHLAVLNELGELLFDGHGLDVKTVVLVLRLGESNHGGLGLDGLTVTNDGLRDLEGNLGVVLLEILEDNLEVELTSTGNNVLTSLGDPGLHTGVGLGETLETFDELGQVVGVLDFDGDLHDGRDGELHDLEVVGGLGAGEGTGLEQELVDTDETKNVTGGAVLDGLDVSAHHEHGTLNRLDEKVVLLTGGVVGTLDTDLGARLDGTGEDTAESVESTLVRGGNHLGNVEHEGTLGVTVSDTDGRLVVEGTLVKGLDTVALGSDGGGKVDDNHLEEGVTGGKELSHGDLEEGLALEVLLILGELDLELLENLGDLILLEVHDGVKDTEDGVEDEHVEGTLERLAISVSVLGGPLLGLGVEEVVTPKLVHHLGLVDTELLGVTVGELNEGESPAVKTGGEGDGTLLGVDLALTEDGVVVGGNDDVDGLNGTHEGLVEVLLADLKLEKSTVDLVEADDGLDTLGKGLSEHGLGLDTNTLDTVDNDKGTVSDTESGSDFGREVDVTGGVDKVDQELVTVRLLSNGVEGVLLHREVHGDGGGLDSDTTLLLIITGVHETGVTGLGTSDNTGLGDERVGKGGFSVVDMGNDRHVTDVGGLVHEATDLVDGEVNHLECTLASMR